MHVVVQADGREPGDQDLARPRVVLTEQRTLAAGSFEPQLDAADAGEEPDRDAPIDPSRPRATTNRTQAAFASYSGTRIEPALEHKRRRAIAHEPSDILPYHALLAAVHLAADKHRDQTRKGVEASPYINHPIAVAEVLARVGGVSDLAILQAAVLHDTLEDTNTTEQELEERFGVEVARIVVEVTDDKSLRKDERKRRQIAHAPDLSDAAKLVKLGDKICNVRDVLHSPPKKWSIERRTQYIDWARKVVDACRGTSEALERHFDELVEEARSGVGGERPSAMSREWSAESWLAHFHRASKERDHDALHSMRADVFRSTVEAIRQRGYGVGGRAVSLDGSGEYDALLRGTVFYTSTDDLRVPDERRGRFETLVSVENADCLEVAQSLQAVGSSPAVLNMANRRNPGGGVLGGAGAQEENLFRRTTLLRSLYQFAPYHAEYDVPPCPHGHRYPIPRESGGIYSPPTAVFRSSEATGYAFLTQPFSAAFLTIPAISQPDVVERDGRLWLSEPMIPATRRKIRAILRIAARHDHADLVLSALGCGAFRNPPHHVARLFRETLEENEFSGVFHRIVFAIFDDHNAHAPHNPEGNYLPFAREFGGPSPSPS